MDYSVHPPDRKRRCQFSLLALMVIVLICGLLFAWASNRIGHRRNQFHALHKLKRMGVRALDAGGQNCFPVPVDSIWALLTTPSTAPIELSRLSDRASRELQSAFLETPADFGTADRPFHDDDIECLLEFPELTCLIMPDSSITDVGVRQLSELPQLKVLDLTGSSITDLGLRTICKIPELRKLYLSETDITDNGLLALGDLPFIEVVDVSGTHVRQEGIYRLFHLCPSLKTIKHGGLCVSRFD